MPIHRRPRHHALATQMRTCTSPHPSAARIGLAAESDDGCAHSRHRRRLWEQVAFEGTSQVTRRLAQYRVPRFIDVPAIDVQLIDRRDVAPAGAGESPITLTAPAIAAGLAATGIRRSELPLTPNAR